MFKPAMADLRKSIPSARKRIEELFVEQCTHGAQARDLDDGIAACGQFIGSRAKKNHQRGVFGTAAALRVLADSQEPKARRLVVKLVAYVEDRVAIEVGLKGEKVKEKCLDDELNVIKISELVYALQQVKQGVAGTEALRKKLAELLMSNVIEGKGWGYSLGDTDIALTPTAYAVRALSSLGYEVREQSSFLMEKLREGRMPVSHSDGTDVMILVLVLFCLAFPSSLAREEDLRAHFNALWRLLEPLLEHDLEQNIEYWRRNDNYYVRIPWQIYLLALAAKLAPRRLGSYAAQRRVRSIIGSVLNGGFVYPHSGNMLSSRTNSVVYEFLGILHPQLSSSALWLVPVYWIDRARNFLSGRVVSYAGYFAALAFAIYSVVKWLGSGSLRDLAPNFISAVVLALLALRKSR